MTDREALRALVEAAQEYGRDVPDHKCFPTEHERAFWSSVADARVHLRDNPTPAEEHALALHHRGLAVSGDGPEKCGICGPKGRRLTELEA
jgi:hypothetical protein